MLSGIARLKKLITISYFTPGENGWCVPVHSEGYPGVAKTAVHYQLAEELGVDFWHLNPTQKGEGAFGVVPVPTYKEDGGIILRFPNNANIERMMVSGRGVLFFDELLSAPRNIRPAMLGTLQERVFGDTTLPPGVRLFAASNPVGVGVNATPFTAPEANRFCHLKWPQPQASELIAYHMAKAANFDRTFYDKTFDPGKAREYSAKAKETEDKVLTAFPRFFGEEISQMLSFAERYEPPRIEGYEKGASGLLALPNKKSVSTDAWCSPRSWSNAARLAAATTILMGKDEDTESLRGTLIAGCVGDAAYAAYASWKEEADLPDYPAWFSGAQKDPELSRARPDRAFLIATGAANYVATSDTAHVDQRALFYYRWLEREHANGMVPSEIAAMSFRKIVETAKARGNGSVSSNSPEYLRLVEKIGATVQVIRTQSNVK